MEEHVGRTRIVMKNGPTYCVTEDVDAVRVVLTAKPLDELAWLAVFESVSGQAAFPPETLFVRPEEVASIQAISDEAWVWIQRAAELHYARQIEDHSALDRLAASQERLVQDVVRGDDD